MSSVSCIWGKSWSYTNLEVTQTYMQFKSYHFTYFLPHWKWFIIHQLQPKHIYLLKVNPTGINETAFWVNVAAWKVWSSLTDTLFWFIAGCLNQLCLRYRWTYRCSALWTILGRGLLISQFHFPGDSPVLNPYSNIPFANTVLVISLWGFQT